MNIVPLGDQACLVYLEDESAAFLFAEGVRRLNASWLLDVVSAYTSVGVFFSSEMVFSEVEPILRQLEAEDKISSVEAAKLHVIPCCYEYQLDLDRIADHCSVSRQDAIRLHIETEYRVYAIGFCPGFPYLGYLAKSLAGVPRLSTPRARVEPGSVGLTGRQTGIYTEPRPGGWNIVGRTPLELVNVADSYFPLRTGDRVRFQSIDEAEFRRLQGERL